MGELYIYFHYTAFITFHNFVFQKTSFEKTLFIPKKTDC